MSKQQLKDLNIALNNFILNPFEKLLVIKHIDTNLIDELEVSTCYDDVIDNAMIDLGL